MAIESGNENIYAEIGARCGGNIYIGVVGPVRTGKSTFIKRFMDTLVIPNIENDGARERARDEMPQSAQGRTVMTAEPKFVPDDPVRVKLDGEAVMNVRMVDCVGYMIPGVAGTSEDGNPRMVHTPWSDSPMPFAEAAELGTKKVICEHSTIGMAVTCDGSVTDIERENYVDAERRVIEELKSEGKPFVIILNSAHPRDPSSIALAKELESEYASPVALVNCLELDGDDIRGILAMTLSEFPIHTLRTSLPSWIGVLPREHELRCALRKTVAERACTARRVSELAHLFDDAADSDCPGLKSVKIDNIDLASGDAVVSVALDDSVYYKTVSEQTGLDIGSQGEMLEMLKTLAGVKRKYDRVADALELAETRGYGIVMPSAGELKLEEPELVKQAGGYGVKLRASAPSIHIIKASIETEISPIVGTEQQSEELIKYLQHELEESPEKIWESNMFGKTLYELASDGLNAKLENMPDDARDKLSETLGRIINEGSGGLICIIL